MAFDVDSILRSIRSGLVPVRREGYPFILIALVLAILFGWLWQPLFFLFLALTLWCAYFFRDPPRVTPVAGNLVVSPADGRVSFAGPAMPPAELGLGTTPRLRISIFMNVFDCHVNRSPVSGRLTRIVYRPGKFLNAELDKASEDNERNAMLVETANGPVGVVQIAGLIARRILCWSKEGDELSPGQRIGMIRFGSRVDVYLPDTAKLRVSAGQTAIAGETVLARFGGVEEPFLVRVD